MTIRQFASTLLRFSIRHASLGSREWGEAMLREMDFVQGDWAALGWAVQSAITLLIGSGAPGAGDLMAGIAELGRTTRRRTWVGGLACVLGAAGFVHNFHLYPNALQRIGSVLVIVAMAFMLGQLCKGRGGRLPKAESSEFVAWYRTELQRQRDFHRGAWLWSRILVLLPGFLLFFIGEAAADPLHVRRSIMAGLTCTVFLILAVPHNLKLARKYQRTLDAVDTSERRKP